MDRWILVIMILILVYCVSGLLFLFNFSVFIVISIPTILGTLLLMSTKENIKVIKEVYYGFKASRITKASQKHNKMYKVRLTQKKDKRS